LWEDQRERRVVGSYGALPIYLVITNEKFLRVKAMLMGNPLTVQAREKVAGIKDLLQM